jgi:hypothetical protein
MERSKEEEERQKRNQGLLYRHCSDKDSHELTTLVDGRGDGLEMDPDGPYRHGLQIVRGSWGGGSKE